MNQLQTRYEYGGDEFVFVQLSEEMSLEANFKGMAITRELKQRELPGIVDICPANASYMVRVDPDVLHPEELIKELKDIEQKMADLDHITIASRLVDVPVLFEDPWTHEAVMRFRDRHQDPESTDLEYSARVNGYDSKEAFIEAITSAPFLVSMIGFVPGLPWCFQMVAREKQIEVPKYVRPRTFTPERTFGFGGAFAVIYPVQGAGGYQMYGIAPAPIYQKEQTLPDFRDSMVFPQQGDIFRYRSITREEYDQIRSEVENGTFVYRKKDFSFTPQEVLEDPDAFSEMVLRRLYHD
ncbi:MULTISPECIES: 5-oxoprolinase subunit B family protein [Brevibacillus]|jgi:urea carboxylase|uniref:Allophanate hydrolase subunit 1 n=1 Tax=Brevibacillus borstelensis AK1 TaxID=1300222 RepID=M8DIL9_9BACL|nr:carboxyltransferase domain-containing protein [Brevibacillus borstelensis]EMT53433.1 allophanate hydrolase subunit 1 [Brevibacillus borstelensis AK1]MBE5394889.1 carboxyltransferase domain-containing protein [Brevibacillus borstelensis]MCC0564195.1 carboxyltransferase domain-containing protein [Brevibacillus borstelensis]MCM3471511.1 carboxyltransferase domain-containing protein [Brevibacillus borstelensis]MCM3559154.1 carboxyltransferase domain-containing protein [Brevibacillus borstelensi